MSIRVCSPSQICFRMLTLVLIDQLYSNSTYVSLITQRGIFQSLHIESMANPLINDVKTPFAASEFKNRYVNANINL